MWQESRRCAALLTGLAFFLTLSHPAWAGTASAPEITDPANDQATVQGGQTTCTTPVTNICFSNADITAAWVDQETATSLQLHIVITGTGAPSSLGTSYTWTFNFKVGATGYKATAHLNGVASAAGAAGPLDGQQTFSGAASSGNIDSSGTNGHITMTVLKSAIGNPASGALTELFVTSSAYAASNNQNPSVSDRAPDGAAFGTDYPLAGGSNTTGNVADSDHDGLNDTWEQSNFGNLTMNGTADPDRDGCDNKCEFDHGSDPNKGDTDGDGFSDGDEVKAGFSPTDPASHPGLGGGSSTSGTTTSGAAGISSSGTGGTGSSTSSGENSNSTTTEGKKSPAPFWLGLVAFVAIAALLRRRL